MRHVVVQTVCGRGGVLTHVTVTYDVALRNGDLFGNKFSQRLWQSVASEVLQPPHQRRSCQLRRTCMRVIQR